MKDLSVRVVADGANGSVVEISGILTADLVEPYDILTLADLSHSPQSLRLDSIVFAIEEKMGCLFWWNTHEGKVLMTPVESRGRLDWEAIRGLNSPRGILGISMTTFKVDPGPKHFTIMMDLTKQST